MKQNLQISVSFEETHIRPFFALVNNFSIIHKDCKPSSDTSEISNILEFFVCYNGEKSNMSLIQDCIQEMYPEILFHFKHIPTEYPELERFLLDHYPFTISRDTLRNCMLYYRLFLDSIWPNLNGLVLQIDLDLIVKSPINLLFEYVEKANKETPAVLFACKYPRIECFDLKLPDLIPEELTEWQMVPGRLLLQKYYLNHWFKTFDESSKILNLNTNLDSLNVNTNLSTAMHFNAGVLMFDITEYRKHNIQQACRDCIIIQKKFNLFFHNDQGILNFVFFNKAGNIPESWNVADYGTNYRYLYDLTKERKGWFDNGHIIHFNGPFKPWMEENKIPDYALNLWKTYEVNQPLINMIKNKKRAK